MSQSPGCLHPNREAMLVAALPVRRAAFRSLLEGHPASFEEIARATGLSDAAVRQATEDVASAGMAEIDGAHVVGMDGLTTRETQHRLTADGVDLFTWCAYDIVGIAAAMGTDASGSTRCGLCGADIAIEIRNGFPGASPVLGWLPEEACSNVMAEFCPSALFFCSAPHLETWRLEVTPPSGQALDLGSLARRGRDEWSQVVGPDFK